jgi:hypothetical protein
MNELGDGPIKPRMVAAVKRYFGIGKYNITERPSVQEEPVKRRTIESPDDLPLRSVAIMVASMDEPFTVDQIALRLEASYIMAIKAREILRRRLYELGARKAIHGEPTVDKAGNTTSIWSRIDKGDQILEEIISPYKNDTKPSG